MEEQEQIITLTEDILRGQPLYLVEVELKGSKENRMIWVYIDSEEGLVSLDQCASLNRELGFILDAKGWHERKYTLNVSSPGLDRPLKDFRQYKNHVGRKASITLKKEDVPERTVVGTLEKVESDKVLLKTEKKEKVVIAHSEIEETRIIAGFH